MEREVALSGETGVVAIESGHLNLRKEPGMEAEVLHKLPAGCVLTQHVKKGVWLKVKAWSGHDGQEGWVHSKYVRLEPDLTKIDEGDKEGDPDPYVYSQVVGQPFHGKPQPGDAEQGRIGDCYFVAAMIALASRPGGHHPGGTASHCGRPSPLRHHLPPLGGEARRRGGPVGGQQPSDDPRPLQGPQDQQGCRGILGHPADGGLTSPRKRQGWSRLNSKLVSFGCDLSLGRGCSQAIHNCHLRPVFFTPPRGLTAALVGFCGA